MSFLDSWTNAAEAPSKIQGQDTQNALQGLDLRQRQGAQNALQHLDISDPGSVNNALTGLLKSGMIDQAKSLTDLAMTRGVNSSSLPVIQDALGMARQKLQAADQSSTPQEQPQQQAADPQGLHDRLMGEAADATGALLAIKDPTERATAANAVRQKFIQEGIPQANVDEVLGDLSDQGLAAHQKFFQDAAAGTPSPHPTSFAASRQQYPDAFSAHNPGGQQAEATLNGPFADPLIQGIMSKYVADVSPGVNQAIAITGPERSAAASAPYTPVTVEGPQGQPESMSAANFARGQADPSSGPIQGITPGQHAAQTARASAPYTPVTVTGAQGQPETISAAQFAEGRGAPAQPGAVTGPTNAPPITGPTIATRAGLQGGAEANTAQATAFEASQNGYALRKGTLDNLRNAAAGIHTGPHAPFWTFLGQLKQEYAPNAPIGIGPNATDTANFEEVHKLAQSVTGQQMTALGLPNTNHGTDLATGATPGEQNSPLGIQRLAGILEGNEVYGQAARLAWQTYKQKHGYESFQDFMPQWNALFDPRVFQAQYMGPEQRTVARQQVGAKRFDAEEAAAKRLGYIG